MKHFKFERRGKKRIHRTPERPEIEACKWWLDRELAVLKPKLSWRSAAQRGRRLRPRGEGAVRARQDQRRPRGFRLLLTVHPSMILRIPDEDGEAKGLCGFRAGSEESGVIQSY